MTAFVKRTTTTAKCSLPRRPPARNRSANDTTAPCRCRTTRTQPPSRSIRSCWHSTAGGYGDCKSKAFRCCRLQRVLPGCPIYLSVDRSRKPPRGHRHFGGALGQLALRERNATGLGQRDRHLNYRLRLSYIPLAHPIAVCSLCQVDVNVIGMIGV